MPDEVATIAGGRVSFGRIPGKHSDAAVKQADRVELICACGGGAGKPVHRKIAGVPEIAPVENYLLTGALIL